MKNIFLLTIVLFSLSCENAKNLVSSKINQSDVSLKWGDVDNRFDKKDLFKSSFYIKNNSAKEIKNWEIYFSFIREVDSVYSKNIDIKHVNGDLQKIVPKSGFSLKPNSQIRIDFVSKFWALNKSDAPQGPFFVIYDNDKNNNKIVSKFDLKYEISPFDLKEVQEGKNDGIGVADALWHYNRNKIISKLSDEKIPKIIPYPNIINEKKGILSIENNTDLPLFFDKKFEREAYFFKDFLNVNLKKNDSKDSGIVIINNPKLEREAYILDINSRRIKMESSSESGVFYAVQSLKSLAKRHKNGIVFPQIYIKDKPRFSYRGMNLDVGRNFQSKEMVLKLLDEMAFYKLNKFHFHLTDDEGWRIEIKGLPELTDVGSVRGFPEKGNIYPAFGSSLNKKNAGTGFYTTEDFVEILKFAKKRHIDVIPEIDMPGHARSAIKSMKFRYNKFMKIGDEQKAKQYLLNDLNDKSEYKSVQGWTDNVVNPCQESTYVFLEKVVDEILQMYKTAGVDIKTLHIGGDEVPHGVWQKSSICDGNELKLTDYFVGRFVDILKKRNLKTSSWDDITFFKKDGKHFVKKDKKDDITPYVWNSVAGWGMADMSYRLANAGYKVVLSNVTNLYFDLAYDKHPEEVGYYWGGFVDAKKVFEFTPFDIRKSYYDKSNLDKLKNIETLKNKQNIIGIQGQLWSENATSTKKSEYLIYPKIISLSQRAWAKKPYWANIEDSQKRKLELNKSWNLFVNKIGKTELNRLYEKKINFRIPPPGVIVENGLVKANSQYPNLNIRYTEDGKSPNLNSKVYNSPIKYDKSKKYKFSLFLKDKKSRVSSIN